MIKHIHIIYFVCSTFCIDFSDVTFLTILNPKVTGQGKNLETKTRKKVTFQQRNIIITKPLEVDQG